MICFDLLVDANDRSMAEEPLEARRRALEAFARRYLDHSDRIVLSPATKDVKTAGRWFSGVGAALDGVVAKRLDLPYQSGNREVRGGGHEGSGARHTRQTLQRG